MIEKIYEKMRWTEIVFVGNNQNNIVFIIRYINKFYSVIKQCG